jgi:hypothetical protein
MWAVVLIVGTNDDSTRPIVMGTNVLLSDMATAGARLEIVSAFTPGIMCIPITADGAFRLELRLRVLGITV